MSAFYSFEIITNVSYLMLLLDFLLHLVSDVVQPEVLRYEVLQEFFDPGPVCSDSVQVELDPNKTLQVDLEHRARFPILNTLTHTLQ